MRAPEWYTRTFGGADPLAERLGVAARHSPLFLLFMALAACCVGAAVLVTLAAWPRTWPLVAVLLVVALVDVWIAWRKGAI